MQLGQNFSFLDQFLLRSEDNLLQKMTEEIIKLYGWPCIHYSFLGNKVHLDGLYGDAPTKFYDDDTIYKKIDSKVYIDWKQFNTILNGEGTRSDESVYLDGFMALDTNPKEDDLLSFVYMLDGKRYTFKLGSTEIYKNVCYMVTMVVYDSDLGNIK